MAKVEGEIVGTVRVFPNGKGRSHWVGGRLAVLKPHRNFRVGKRLVQEAMKQVKRCGCSEFTAYIQENNVHFFERLGWTPIDTVKMHFGRPHRLMQADLKRIS